MGSYRADAVVKVGPQTGETPPAPGKIKGGGTVAEGDEFAHPDAVDGEGDGTIGNPYSMRDALAYGLSADKTMWLRGGTYPSPKYGGLYSYWCGTGGTAGHPAVVRSYPGEWAKIDMLNTDDGASIGQACIKVQHGYVHFRDFEIMSSMPDGRISSQSGSWPDDIHFGSAISPTNDWDVDDVRYINLIIHDTTDGLTMQTGNSPTYYGVTNGVIYGNIIYYAGWKGTDRGHGHAIYPQNWNTNSARTIAENVMFRSFSCNAQLYNESAMTEVNTNFQGNVIFASGMPGTSNYPERNFTCSGDADPVADGTVTMHENLLYSTEVIGSDFQIGLPDPVHYYTNPNVHDNFMPRIGVQATMSGTTANITGNTLTHTEGDDFDIASQNTFRSEPLTGLDVFVRPNSYEAQRAHIIVYNWDLSSTVSISLSSLGFQIGDRYAIYNCQDILGDPVTYGYYTATDITLPMTTAGGLTQAQPSANYTKPLVTWPEFNVFLVRKY